MSEPQNIQTLGQPETLSSSPDQPATRPKNQAMGVMAWVGGILLAIISIGTSILLIMALVKYLRKPKT